MALSWASSMLERLAESFSTGFPRLVGTPEQLPEVDVEAWDQGRLPGEKDPGDLAGGFLGAVVLDGTLHLVGEGLRGAL